MSEQNKTRIDFIDQTYRLEEMADAIRQSIANINKVSNEQIELVNIVNASDKAENFKAFVKGVEEQIDKLNAQKVALNIQAGLLDQIVDACHKDTEKAKLISMLLKALRVFDSVENVN